MMRKLTMMIKSTLVVMILLAALGSNAAFACGNSCDDAEASSTTPPVAVNA